MPIQLMNRSVDLGTVSRESHKTAAQKEIAACRLAQQLTSQQSFSGAWSYSENAQASIEATCLGALALVGLNSQASEKSTSVPVQAPIAERGLAGFCPGS